MKGFFKDTEVKYFSFEEKLGWIFKQLLAILSPRPEIQNYGFHDPIRNKYVNLKISRDFNIDPAKLSFIQQVEIPQKWGIKLEVIDEKINITGIFQNKKWKKDKAGNQHYYDNDTEFGYSFPPDMLSEMYNRMKRKKLIK